MPVEVRKPTQFDELPAETAFEPLHKRGGDLVVAFFLVLFLFFLCLRRILIFLHFLLETKF